MNTKKANLKKLRLPRTETNNGLRNGQRKVTSTISDFFSIDADNSSEDENKQKTMECSEPMPSPIEYSQPMPSPIEKLEDEPSDKPTRSTRTKLKTFLPKDKRMKPSADTAFLGFIRKTNDFETPAKSIKSAPKIKEKTKTTAKAKPKPRPKKQQKIKSAFFQNEELFSDVTAQHCLVDNINPDEMQMALALSRSEIEISGSSVESSCAGKGEGIREKLKKFGFQVAESEDFNYAAAYKVTKGKNKWANKFTSLTLRNSTRQLEKANQKIKEILKVHVASYELATYDEEMPQTGSVQSSIILPFVAANRIIQPDSSGRLETVDFYVLSLFEPSRTKPGYLLKDMRRIPGRDRSPVKRKSSLKENCILHEKDSPLKSPVSKRVRVNESALPIEFLLSPNVNTGSNEALECSQQSLPSTITTPHDSKQRHRKASSVLDLQITSSADSIVKSISSIGCEKETSLAEETLKQFDTTSMHKTNTSTETSTNGSKINSSMLLRPIRANSPDIFADSDVEMETDDGSGTEKLNCTSSIDNIETYEIFSSDEVKTISDSKVDSCDKNHNSLIAMIDLTQQESESSSQNSAKLIPGLEPIQTYLELSDLPSTSFGFHINEETLTRSRFLKETDLSFESNAPEKSTLIKRKNGFSFGSSASDDFCKSTSFNNSKDEEHSIDLTQNNDEVIDFIVLSDDEVNYSIRKADKSLHVKDEKSSADNSFESDSKEKQEFSFVDFVASTQPLATQSEAFELSFTEKPNNSFGSSEMDLSKRSDFGILDEQSPFKIPTKTPKKTPRITPTKSPKITNTTTNRCRRALSESFLGSPAESSAPLKRFSSSNKFKEFTKNEEGSFSDLDDIDKLIYGSPTKKIYKKPTGLTQLLTGAINEKIVTPEKSNQEVPKEFEFNDRTYLVRTVDVSRRPNFRTMDESALLDKLYRYGIKPLKRKQAEKILEYIYNQTHPCLVDEDDLPSTAMSDHDSDFPSQDVRCDTYGDNILDDGEIEVNEGGAFGAGSSKFNLKDCWGHVLVSDNIPSMEIKDEQYFFQTNNSKKISTAQLPLHIAWYNLLKSNTQLHEAILYYEPIDLQEVYLFLKSIGYRYDPKEMKYFFDSRSIIFRYDVKKSENSAGNRHVRKKRQKLKT